MSWYVDLGVSDDATNSRNGFHAMVADGANGGFDAIFCWAMTDWTDLVDQPTFLGKNTYLKDLAVNVQRSQETLY